MSDPRRKNYRRAVKAGRRDHFNDMMESLIKGGSRPCEACGIVSGIALQISGVCGPCRRSLGKIRAETGKGGTPRVKTAPNTVWVDASYNESLSRAGLAITGALGEHQRTVDARSSTHAEWLALQWAMELARADKWHDLVFLTDCQSVYNQCHGTGNRYGWVIEQIPRSNNRRADFLAGVALRAELAA